MALKYRFSHILTWTIAALTIAMAPMIPATSTLDNWLYSGETVTLSDGTIVIAVADAVYDLVIPADVRPEKQWINTPHDAHAGVYGSQNRPGSTWRMAVEIATPPDPHIRA